MKRYLSQRFSSPEQSVVERRGIERSPENPGVERTGLLAAISNQQKRLDELVSRAMDEASRGWHMKAGELMSLAYEANRSLESLKQQLAIEYK